MMRLYHGSNVVVPRPEILNSDRKLDFGVGFYLTSSLEQAERWARLVVDRRGGGRLVVTVYEIDEAQLSTLRVRRFEKANRQWLNFVVANRESQIEDQKWDVVIGPVANDRTMPVIRLFMAKVYTAAETLRRLLPQNLHDQYTFKTVEALQRLQFKECVEL